MYRIICHGLLAVFIACTFPSCNQGSEAKSYEPTYYPDTSPESAWVMGVPNLPFYDLMEPLVKYINQHLPSVRVKMVAGGSFSNFLRRLQAREFDITLVGGSVALDQEKNGYTIIGKLADDSVYRGAIIVHADSPIVKLSDLIGRKISSSGRAALAGHMMPAKMMFDSGVNVNTQARVMDVNSFESVILNVYHGRCSAGFVWLSSARSFLKKRPEIEAKLKIRWITAPLPNVAILMRNSLPEDAREELKKALFSVHKYPEGRRVLELVGASRFEPANTGTYRPVRRFMEMYRKIPNN